MGCGAVTPEAARRLAERIHAGELDRYGQPLLDHVRRVAATVPPEARAVAWLHELLECDVPARALSEAGVGDDELRAVELLTRRPSADPDEYEAHVRRISEATGRPGDLARAVKRADLRDRLRHQGVCAPSSPVRPSYRRALSVLGAAPG